MAPRTLTSLRPRPGASAAPRSLRALDWTYRPHKDGIFGEVKGKSRWVKVKDLDDDDDKEWLSTGWDDPEGEHVQSYVESVGGGWTANQVSLVCCGYW